jgi:hypothetical protein
VRRAASPLDDEGAHRAPQVAALQTYLDTVPLPFGFLDAASVCHLFAGPALTSSIISFTREILRDLALVLDPQALRVSQ